MIKFTSKFKVLKVENKSVQKRDGGTFDFVEALLEEGAKKKTQLVARVSDDVHISAGLIADMSILVTSHDYNGRVFNSFLITDVDEGTVATAEPAQVDPVGDNIPF